MGTDLSAIQAELGRIDYTGSLKNFKTEMLYGARLKATAGGLPLPYNFSLGLSISWSIQTDDEYIIGSSINISWGKSPFKVGVSFNKGVINP